ncbi:MAG: helix-turn-helix transcriptional regulator [Clostridia bacterium]|nr:helix-turn-helix transcriptional regulator [Clostridia bacterium]
MNKDFPRIITMLRKEKKLSQKQAAQELGISQALLSHYEKGIRECGLDFLIKVSDYYSVSCDFLLGRTPERTGAMLRFEDIPEAEDSLEQQGAKASLVPLLNKKILSNTLTIIYDMLIKANNKSLTANVSNYLMLALYKVFRGLYSANKENHQSMFAIPRSTYAGFSEAQMKVYSTKFEASTDYNNTHDYIEKLSSIDYSSENITEDYPKLASSLFNLIQHSENKLKSKAR